VTLIGQTSGVQRSEKGEDGVRQVVRRSADRLTKSSDLKLKFGALKEGVYLLVVGSDAVEDIHHIGETHGDYRALGAAFELAAWQGLLVVGTAIDQGSRHHVGTVEKLDAGLGD
jgi:hypothetical protein